MPEPAHDSPVRIVVLGGGFAGLEFCKHLRAPGAEITLVDRQNHHLFQPLLYQVAVAGLSATDIAQPIRSILRDREEIRVRLCSVERVDLAARRVFLADSATLDYDYLVVALGGRTGYFGRDEWERHAPGLKTLDDALAIRRRLLLAFEQAENESDPARVRELLTAVVVGAGPTGVELAGAIAELAKKILLRDFRRIDPAGARVLLLEGGPRVLPTFPPDLSEKARLQLERLGVEVRLGAMVSAIRENEIVVAPPRASAPADPASSASAPPHTIRAGVILWAAGIAAAPLTRSLGVPLDRAGRILVQPDLGLPGHPEVFALGDIASVALPEGPPVPGVAPAAMQMGRHAARVVSAEIRAKRRPGEGGRPVFVYRDKGNLATIGRAAGVAQLGRLRFSGRPAWTAWLLVHLVFLVGFRNRLSVLLSWTYSYFTYKSGARIVTGLGARTGSGVSPTTHPGAAAGPRR
jgi:NADH dehydrogenase, FAD-containing subunit